MSVKRSRIGHREAAQLQAIDEPLEIDAALRILGRDGPAGGLAR